MATTKDLFNYLTRLNDNNNREWFQENKEEYEELRAMWSNDIDRLIKKMSLYDDSLIGLQAKDCIYRIYRDVRFSKEKTPYKPFFSAAIGRGGRKCTSSSYYIHLHPGNSGLHGGVWCPDAKLLSTIRHSIDDNIEEFLEIIEDKELKKRYNLVGDSLKTMPREFPREHEYSQYIKMKEFLLEYSCPDSYFTDNDWVENAANDYQYSLSFHKFINYGIEEENNR